MSHSRLPLQPSGLAPARRVIAIGIAASLLSASCATSALWKATNPDAGTWVPHGETSEAALHERGVTFTKETTHFRIGKSSSQRLRDHALRVAFTPATVCVDALAAVPILAYLALASHADSGDTIQSGGEGWQHIEPGDAPSGPPSRP